MIEKKLIDKTIEYYNKYKDEQIVVNPSLPILYFGDLEAYKSSRIKVLTVGKNPSDNEFCLKKNENYSFVRFSRWDPCDNNLVETLNEYFRDRPLNQWFSSFEPILNGFSCSYYNNVGKNVALHTDICSPLATFPTWSKLTTVQQNLLFEDGFVIWKELINYLQPDFMLISVPNILFRNLDCNNEEKLISFDKKINGESRKKPYIVKKYEFVLNSGKISTIIFGQAANKPFDTISNEQKKEIGLCLCEK